MMHFPWKKVKSTRLSHLLSDQIHQRRGKGVVETGFPTSLVDLFVKNKHRLRKPWRRNKQLSKNSTCLSSLDDDDKDSCCVFSWCPCPPPPPSPEESSPLHCSEAEAFGYGGLVLDGNGGNIDSCDANSVLRMFLVGVTISAFLVLLVGYIGQHNTGKAAYLYFFGAFCTAYDFYVGKNVSRLLTACIELEKKLRLMILKVKNDFFWHILFNLEKYGRKLLIRPGAEVKEKLRWMILKITETFGYKKDHQEAKIEILEDLSFSMCCVEEIGCAKERICDSANSTNSGEDRGEIEMDLMKPVYKEERNRCENVQLKRRKSYEARVKLKMKELVPKGLRSLRKKGRIVQKEGNPFVPSLRSLSREFNNGEDKICNLNANCELMERKMEGTLNREEGKTGSGCNSGYAFMLLAVLIGLIGGRIVALVLTLTWCLMRKSGKTGR